MLKRRRKTVVTADPQAAPPLDGGASLPAFVPDGVLPAGDYPTMTILREEVIDPLPHPDAPLRRSVAARNIRNDILKQELAHNRISREAYNIGREYEEALLILGGSGQSQWLQGDRVDAGRRVELAVVAGMDRASRAVKTIERMDRAMGQFAGPVVRMALRERMTFGQIAVKFGRPDNAEWRNYFARVFRDALDHAGKSA